MTIETPVLGMRFQGDDTLLMLSAKDTNGGEIAKALSSIV